MRASVNACWAPRAGSEEQQYEDAYYPRTNGDRHARRLRFAVADGASESMLSGLWADLLVRTWCKARRRGLPHVVRAASQLWEIELAAYLEQRQRSDRPIQWFEEPGLEKGAFATLLGVSFATGASASHGTWRAASLGDSCLFQVRDGALLAAFPIEHASEFDSRPKLVPSRLPDDGFEKVVAHVDTVEGEWRTGDTFLLVTDAIAAWFLRATEAGEAPWKTLADFDAGSQPAFREWLTDARARHEVRNDDATVLRVDVR